MKPGDLSRLDAAFFTMNGVISSGLLRAACSLARAARVTDRGRSAAPASSSRSPARPARPTPCACCRRSSPRERDVWLIVSSHGLRLLETEIGHRALEALRAARRCGGWDRLVSVYDDGDRGAAPASGSARTAGMVICPCSMGTLAAIAAGHVALARGARGRRRAQGATAAAARAARDAALARSTSRTCCASRAPGRSCMPASPGFYHRPRDDRGARGLRRRARARPSCRSSTRSGSAGATRPEEE